MIQTKNIILLLGLIGLFCNCEREDRFYRPRVPQKLSALAIIDADDTLRYIRFEKTFQVEYPEDLTDSLRDLSFTISDSKGVIISFYSDGPLKSPYTYIIPDSIEFLSGETYFFRAKEKDCPEIYSEITAPEPPSGLALISLEREILRGFVNECHRTNISAWVDKFNITFHNDISGSSCFVVLIESYGAIPKEKWYWFRIEGDIMPRVLEVDLFDYYTRFSVMKSDAHGFISMFPGLSSYIMDPCNEYMLIEKPAPAYYIDGRKAQDKSIRIVLTNQSNNGVSVPTIPITYRIRLLSVSQEMYQFIKNLYTYERNLDDPFAEPVYFKGNVEGGYGVFAICRSIEINIEAPPPIWLHIE